MNIEIGKSYEVSNAYKKCFEEMEYLKHDTKDIRIQTNVVWRSGTVIITPQSEDEVEELTISLHNEDGDEFSPSFYEENEFAVSTDGCSDEIFISGEDATDKEMERLSDGYYDDGISFLEEEGFYTYDNEIIIHAELEVKEFEGYVGL